MLEVYVCVGTSCHLRGGERVAEQLAALVREAGLQSAVKVRGSFCLEHCSEGVSVKVGDTVLSGIQPTEVRERLLPEILTRVQYR
jgi:NADH-quinone oxidoreductase subunit G